MNCDGDIDVTAVSASDGDRDRNPNLPRRLEDHDVPARESGFAEAKPPELVELVRIRSGEIDDQIRSRRGEHSRQGARQKLEKCLIAGSILELYVE
jgi:hypothetical protein